MSDTTRGVALLLSVLLWAPVAPGLLSGDTGPERALLLYAAAFVLAVAGCAALSGLLRAYAPVVDEEPTEGEPASLSHRRAEDLAA